jgi:hypothetical protein
MPSVAKLWPHRMINVGHLHHEELLGRGGRETGLLSGPMLHLKVSLLLAKLGKEVYMDVTTKKPTYVD